MMHALRVLIADDDRAFADSLVRLIKAWGYDGFAAYDGAMAVEAARAWRPDMALLDIAIPQEQDGYTLARQLRPEVPVLVAVSGYLDPERQHRCLEAGFNQVLIKPVTPKELQALLGAVENSRYSAGGWEGNRPSFEWVLSNEEG
jgi:CheY-like chemotaxis protein